MVSTVEQSAVFQIKALQDPGCDRTFTDDGASGTDSSDQSDDNCADGEMNDAQEATQDAANGK